VTASVVAISSTAVARTAEGQTAVVLESVRAIAADESVRCFGARSIENHAQCGNQYGKINTSWAKATKADWSLNIIDQPPRWCPYYRIGDWDDPTNVCYLGDRAAQRSIVLWGDSHADQWANAMNAIGLQNHLRVILLSSGECANEAITAPQCGKRLDFIRKQGFLDHSSAVIVSILAKDVGKGSATVLSTVRSMTRAPAYFFEDVPVASAQSGPECYLTKKRCTDPETWALQGTRANIAAMEASGVLTEDHVIRTSDMFCRQDTCYSFIGNAPVYRDTDNVGNSHISSVYSRSLAGLLQKKLKDKGAI
jgi:hypothetical protein